MAKLAHRRAKHPELMALARQIIAAYQREVRIMKPFGSDAMPGMHGS